MNYSKSGISLVKDTIYPRQTLYHVKQISNFVDEMHHITSHHMTRDTK